MSRAINSKGTTTKKSKKSPIRVILRCAWDGSRLTVPAASTADGNGNAAAAAITGSTTLFDLVRRLESSLPSFLFVPQQQQQQQEATLVCLRKVVARSEWETTTLKRMMDGDDGSAGVVLTLDLGSMGDSPSGRVGGGGGNVVTNAIASAASKMNIKPQVVNKNSTANVNVASAASGTVATDPEPMDISSDHGVIVTTTNTTTSSALTKTPQQSPPQAWAQILQNPNFDATIKDCLTTLLKIIHNLLSRPQDPKVRSIRCANAAFEKKVGRCVGAFDFLYSLGFVPKFPAIGGCGGSAAQPELLELSVENESREVLLQAREVLMRSAMVDLNMKEEELPSLPQLPVVVTNISPATMAPPSATAAPAAAQEFNVYKTHSHNVQSAAVGAPDPYNNASVSITERQLQQLQSKKDKLEREMQGKVEVDRGLVAYRPGSSGPSTILAASGSSGDARGAMEGKGDGSLVAARMKRMEEERKKREEGGFTTKAMRDLEKMKKAKVYSHAQIRINFADGTHLHAKFLPSEKVSTIRSAIQSSFHPTLCQSLDFDLYVAPPRRLLNDTNTLEAEELVPAAKIHVSWKVGGAPPPGGIFLREELFGGSASMAAAFPDAKPIVEERKKASSVETGGKDGNNNKGTGQSKEELLMQRMMGKKGGLLGGGSNKKPKEDGSKKDGKPKWFK